MADCNDPNLRERSSLLLIPVGCALMDFLRRLRRPGSTATTFVVTALAVATGGREFDWPHKDWWKPGSVGQKVIFGLTVLAAVGTFLLVLGFRRLLAKQHRKERLQTGAESFAKYVEQETSLHRHEIGVNIWLIRGLLGFRRLVRDASVAEPRKETPITWTKGKGIIGEAWSRNTERFADLDEVRRIYPRRRHFCALRRADRFRLSWDEFEKTRRYHAVLAVPLNQSRFGRHPVRGVVAIDVLVPGKAQEIDGIQTEPGFSSILRTCEAALDGDE